MQKGYATLKHYVAKAMQRRRLSAKGGFIGIVLLVIVVAAIALAAAFYPNRQFTLPGGTATPSASPAPSVVDETANWKTYTNTKFRISIKYPSTYQFSSTGPNISQKQLDNGQQVSGTVAPSYDTINFTGGNQDFTLGIFHIPDSSLIDNLSGGFDGSCGSQFADKTLVDKLDSIGSTKYRERQQQVSSKVNIQYCFLSGTKNLVVLSVFGISNENIEKANQFLKQIISTVNTAFKFLDQNQNSNTSSWKTYGSTKFGFEVKYPNDPQIFLSQSKDNNGFKLPSYHIDFGVNTKEEFEQFMNKPFPSQFNELEYVGNIPPLTNKKKITVGGIEALRGDSLGKYEQDFDLDVVIFTKRSALYSFTFNRSAAKALDTLERDKKVFDQILTTFQFTD